MGDLHIGENNVLSVDLLTQKQFLNADCKCAIGIFYKHL